MRAWYFLAVLAAAFVSAVRAQTQPPAAVTEREVENLAVFARVYGYVRFFHPSDEVAAVDWDKMAILGAEAVRGAPDRAVLRETLRVFFKPVAPTLRLEETLPEPAAIPPPAGAVPRVTFWQYHGIRLSEQSNIYSNRRVITGESGRGRSGLFTPVEAPEELRQVLVPGIALAMPMALRVDDKDRTVGGEAEELKALQVKLATLDLKAMSAADWRVRVGGVVTVWSVFQHFHPYLDLLGVKWDEALAPSLRRTLADRTAEDYGWTLAELVAKTQDGHGYVYGRKPSGGIPVRFAVVDGQVVVTAVGDGVALRKGDVLERIDGVAAMEQLRDSERYTAGSPHLRRLRTLNQFGQGTLGSVAKLEIKRNGEAMTVELSRGKERRGFFFNSIGEFELPAFAEVRPGIFYVNLPSIDPALWEEKLPQLAKARGVIFDQRWDGRMMGEGKKQLRPHLDVIPHLTDTTVRASPMRTPQVTQPDRQGWSYRESTWPVEPKAPRFAGKIVFINEPSVVSYGETCMAIIADYNLATLVGEPTAGTNGNANYILLPTGLRVMWTGMDVQKHDHTSFYGIGFGPSVPSRRTLEGVTQARDEYRELAIEVIEKARPLAAPATTTP